MSGQSALFFKAMEEMGVMLRACAVAVGISPNQVLRFAGLYQIVDTGLDVVWVEGGSPSGGPGWVVRETYFELDLATDVDRTVTEEVASAEAGETAAVAKTVFLRACGRFIDHALAEAGG